MDKKIILYVILGILLLGLIVFTLFPNMIHALKDSRADGEDKCSPPPGQSEEAWREHMSHHPDIYKECFN
jgi:hypothetical protein